MSISITEIHPLLGARVEGVDLRQPITADDVAFIEQSIARYPVLVFPAQIIDDRQQIEFSLNFGTLQTATTSPPIRIATGWRPSSPMSPMWARTTRPSAPAIGAG